MCVTCKTMTAVLCAPWASHKYVTLARECALYERSAEGWVEAEEGNFNEENGRLMATGSLMTSAVTVHDRCITVTVP